ncbi:something about silencing, SAS, complex subunit 4-domain-containing protein [Aspergillus pseudodeflectus]|uniref:Something about silencing, SAS, complex subunit 4-domain-containing protein n=1 Tax=Aspergillus pseudodeflectus TaxID=176178 RepID=A0ABR4LBZ6_9EURO
MLRPLLVTAAAVGAGSIAASIYLSNWKRSLASRIIHTSKNGQISPSTPKNISSLPTDIFSSRYHVLYDYASTSAPRSTLPNLDPSALLTMLLRRNMSSFASSPQARILKFTASGSEIQQSFDTKHIQGLNFEEGDLVCNAYQVKLRTEDKAEFEFKFGVQGRLVVRAEVRGDDVVFHNETIMWRERESKSKLPLERGLAQWVHELTAYGPEQTRLSSPLLSLNFPGTPMTSTAVMAVRSRSSLRVLRSDPNDAGDNSVQPPPAKRPRIHRPTTSRRQGSSPDLLDTTIETPPPSNSTKLRRPRPLFALSAHTTSSPPPVGTPRARNLRVHHHDTPTSNNAALYLNGGRESPDPLDTISPAPTVTFKTTPKPSNTPTSAAYRQRRITQFLKAAPDPSTTPELPKPKNARISRGNAAPTPPKEPTPDPTSVPAATADRVSPEKRRSLRSHDGGSRARSELALYFPNYEELLSLEPPKTEFLTGNTTIKLIDDLHEPPIPPSAISGPDADTPFGNPLVDLQGCETITLPETLQLSDYTGTGSEHSKGKQEKEVEEDPLNEEVYFKAHRRHERQEKQLRNIERDRAQHEKQQLDRLLDELQSQDWLRVMGITGRSLTDQEKKLYEPKRDYFIKEISALLQKFKIWKEEEKRRKFDKDHKSSSFHSDPADSSHAKDKDTKSEDEPDDEKDATELTPDINDVDALAAHQLLQEARSATAGKRSSKSKQEPELPPPVEPDKPFTSFFSKPHLREAAMLGNRKGRTRLAFGHPIPEVEEKEFELPGDILTAEAIKSCQRKRRRMKRGSLGGG